MLRLRYGASTSSQESRRQVSGSDCQLFRFRLGRSSKIKEVNQWFIGLSVQWFIGFSVQCQPSVNKQNSGVNCSFFSRKLALRNDSSSSRVIGNQEFHSGVQFSHLVIFSQRCHSDRLISRKINGFKIGHFTPSSSIFGFKMRSKRASWSSRRLELTSTHQMFSQNMFQRQFLVNIFLV